MSSALALLAATGTNAPTYVDDVFSTYLYTGNGSTQTITNGIDLAGKGGLVWLKDRTNGGGQFDHALYDTDRGVLNTIYTNQTAAQISLSNSLTAFGSSGFSIGTRGLSNSNNVPYASWTFRKAAKFFDVVTWTGNSTSNRAIPHSLGSAPGMAVIKCISRSGDSWWVYHRSLGQSAALQLNGTGAQFDVSGGSYFGTTAWDASNFYIGTAGAVNDTGVTYLAYLFAHDTTTDGLIQCGSYTTDSSGKATVNIGFEPQFLLIKGSSATSAWAMIDSMRGLTVSNSSVALLANSSAAEGGPYDVRLTATGFIDNAAFVGTAQTFIYLAIRRPNKPPTSGTQVYNAIARTGTGAAATVTGVGFAPDLLMTVLRTSPQGCATIVDRLRGPTPVLLSSNTASENTTYAATEVQSFEMDGFKVGTSAAANWFNNSGSSLINWFFRRAPGVFDVVCYTGTGSTTSSTLTVSHGLGVAPEMVIIKYRSGTAPLSANWHVHHNGVLSQGASYPSTALFLNTTAGIPTSQGDMLNAAPTATQFVVRSSNTVNSNGIPYVAYLFATKAGISKVGSYTGNGGAAGTTGTSQTINCGFTTGARFVMIKTTSDASNWEVFDTARGIVAGNDPILRLNTTSAEFTTYDELDPDSTGFVVNQGTGFNLNVTGRTYIYLAFA